jgi:hypothetical protein
MNRRRLWSYSAAALLVIVAAYLTSCTVNKHRLETNFEAVTVGTTEADFLARMGPPHAADSSSTVNATFASRPCEAPCTRRVWYYNSLQPPGLEAWSFELDANGRVVRSAHWVSP